MRTSFAKSALPALFLALSMGACSYQAGVMSVISAQRVALNDQAKGPKKVTGESCAMLSLANLDEAVRDAMSKAGPNYDALVGTTVSLRVVPFYHNCFVVTGTPISTGGSAPAPAAPAAAPAPAQEAAPQN